MVETVERVCGVYAYTVEGNRYDCRDIEGRVIAGTKLENGKVLAVTSASDCVGGACPVK